jgi:sugar/nucleoside kinase (ribokinase family)
VDRTEGIIKNKKRIVGVGSALVDVLVYERDEFLEKIGAARGGMTLVDNGFLEDILAKAAGFPQVVPGGSACNTMIGIARLGGVSRFVGKRGQDETGEMFENGLTENGVEPMLFTSPLSTGRVVSIITQDAQRTMFTCLGASADTRPEELSASCFADTAVVHIEGYLLFDEALIMAAMKGAKNSGARISLDLASYTVVEESNILKDIVREYVDILIANEDEALAFTGHSDDNRALEALAKDVDMAVLKVGKRGSYICDSKNVIRVNPMGDGSAVDTTGAGDLWASGFLYGIVNDYPLDVCGKLGSACGYEVCQVVGAQIPGERWEHISAHKP